MSNEELLRIQRDLAVALNGETNLHDALMLCLTTALKVSGAAVGGIHVFDDAGGLDLVVGQGMSSGFLETAQRFEQDIQRVEVIRTGVSTYLRVEELPPGVREACQAEGLKASAFLPIHHVDECIACINLGSREARGFPDVVRRQLEGIAAILGGAIVRLRAETACRQSRQTLAALLDANTESAFLVDLEGVVVVANQTLADRLNTTVAELVGRSIADFATPQMVNQARSHCEQVVATGKPQNRVVEWGGRHFSRRIHPICDEEGNVVLLAGFSAEITARRQAEQKIQAEQRLLRELLDLQERERKLISHELHDGFVQDIVGAQMLLDALASKPDLKQAPTAGELEAVRALLQKAIAEARRMIRDLRPVIIRDDSGVVGALHDMVAQEDKLGGLRIRFEHDVRFRRLDPMLEGTIFRIVHEALVNARKHSGADELAIRLTESDDLLLEIEDQGKGFQLNQVPPDRFGVRGIQERARLFGGQATIESQPGRGTRITVELPLRDPKTASNWLRKLADPGAE